MNYLVGDNMGTKVNYCELPKDAKVVPGFSKYFADPLGNIYSKYRKSGYIKLHTHIDKNTGYVRCRNLLVHRLVALAFFGDKEDMEINHKNGNKRDNSISNLEWVTHKENILHAWKTGLAKGIPHSEEEKRKISEALKGKPHSDEHIRKLSEALKGKGVKPVKVIFNDNTEMIFNSARECANFLKVYENDLSKCINGKRKVPKRCNVKEVFFLNDLRGGD